MNGRYLTWTSALSSMALCVTGIALALHVRLGVGHWPKPMWEEYRTPLFDAHGLAFMVVGLFTAFAAVPLWGACLYFSKLRLSTRTHLIQAGFYLAGWGLIGSFIALDPYQFVSWLLD